MPGRVGGYKVGGAAQRVDRTQPIRIGARRLPPQVKPKTPVSPVGVSPPRRVLAADRGWPPRPKDDRVGVLGLRGVIDDQAVEVVGRLQAASAPGAARLVGWGDASARR